MGARIKSGELGAKSWEKECRERKRDFTTKGAKKEKRD